jgi:hypothetical protein
VIENPESTEGSDHSDLISECDGKLHPLAIKGLSLFNAGQYWDAHEAFEDAWRDEEGEIRNLYQGILQAGVTYLQIERNNFVGMAKMYERALKWLSGWPDHCRGLNIGKLRNDLDKVILSAGDLGPEGLHEFDRSLFKTLEMID